MSVLKNKNLPQNLTSPHKKKTTTELCIPYTQIFHRTLHLLNEINCPVIEKHWQTRWMDDKPTFCNGLDLTFTWWMWTTGLWISLDRLSGRYWKQKLCWSSLTEILTLITYLSVIKCHQDTIDTLFSVHTFKNCMVYKEFPSCFHCQIPLLLLLL